MRNLSIILLTSVSLSACMTLGLDSASNSAPNAPQVDGSNVSSEKVVPDSRTFLVPGESWTNHAQSTVNGDVPEAKKKNDFWFNSIKEKVAWLWGDDPTSPEVTVITTKRDKTLIEKKMKVAQTQEAEGETYEEVSEKADKSQAKPMNELLHMASATVEETKPVWSVPKGAYFMDILAEWVTPLGYEVVSTQEGLDWPVLAAGSFEGDFEEALQWLVDGFETAKVRPVLKVLKNAVIVEGVQ